MQIIQSHDFYLRFLFCFHFSLCAGFLMNKTFIHLKQACVFFYAYFGNFIDMLVFLYYTFYVLSHNLHKNIWMETQIIEFFLAQR